MPDTTDPRSPMDRAIDAVEADMAAADQLPPGARVAVVPLLTEAHAWDQNAEVTIGAPPDGEQPSLFIWDVSAGAYRAVYLPLGSMWRVVPDHAAAAARRRPTLWVPGGEQ